MKSHRSFCLHWVAGVAMVLGVIGGSQEVLGDSAILDVVDPTAYETSDIATDCSFYSFDVSSDGSTIAGWDGMTNAIQVIDLTTGTSTSLGAPSDYSAWNSFTTLDPSGASVWAGFTNYGTTDDRIYQVDLATGAWTLRAKLSGNFDMAFCNDKAYVSGLNATWSGGTDDTNCIWLLDTTLTDVSGDNGSLHTKVVELGGNSAGLAVDAAGNLYYASYNGDNAGLYRWDAASVANAESTGVALDYSTGIFLSELEAGAYDVAVDDAGHVLLNGNGSYSYVAMWDGTPGSGYNYEILSVGGDSSFWHTMLDAYGDVTAGGAFFQTDYNAYGIGMALSLNAVPEPSTATALLCGVGLALIASLRRRRKMTV